MGRKDLPSPISHIGWFSAILLIVLMFFIYYLFLYGCISKNYQKLFWSSNVSNSNSEEDVSIRVHVPRYIADFVDREIRIESWSRSDDKKDINLVVQAEMYDTNWENKLKRQDCEPIELNQPFVYISTESSAYQKENNSIGKSSVTLNLPERGSSSASLWMIMQPDIQIENGNCVVLRIYEILPKTENLDHYPDDCHREGTLLPCSLPYENKAKDDGIFVVRFDREKTFFHSLISNLLLPPWSNIVFPAIAFFIVGFAEKIIEWNENRKNGTVKDDVFDLLKRFSLTFSLSFILIALITLCFYVLLIKGFGA